MSSVVDPQPDPAADEIVAYLDGELPPEQCRRVENRLATDEEYRQQLHELDRAWDALDVLPAPTVDDGFARTTIELACVAAEADLGEHVAASRKAKRRRIRMWSAATVAAVAAGALAGQMLLPNRNSELLADLPAIQQLNVLTYVDDVDFLRRLPSAVPHRQLVKDEQAFEQNVKDLERANSPSIQTRREWVQELRPDQKAELADRQRAFNDLAPSSGERERMRQIMDDIRAADDAPELQKTLIAYGQWLARHPAPQQEQLREELHDLPPDEQATIVARFIRREENNSWRHLSDDDAKTLRGEVLKIADEKRPQFLEKMAQRRRGPRLQNIEGEPVNQGLAIIWLEIFNDQNDETAKRLVGKLSQEARTHWERLPQAPRNLRKWQLGVWIRDAMHLKLDPEDLEKFFAREGAGSLSIKRRQELLDMTRSEMDTELKRQYLGSELGIEEGQWLREFGEPGRMPRNIPGLPGRESMGPNRPFGPGGRRELRPDGAPNEQRINRPPRRPADRSAQPTSEQKSI
jgi:hypothetical protein